MSVETVGLVILFILIVTAYALICRAIGEYANRKGYSYWLFVAISFFISPLWGIIIAWLLPERDDDKKLPLRSG